jgi:acetyl-CoA carboxylase carboxyltransferase component
MASKIEREEIFAQFYDDGEYTPLFADGAVSAACGYANGQQAYAVFQNGAAVTVKDVEKNTKVLEMAAQTGAPVVTFYNSVGARLDEGLDVLGAAARLNAQIARVSGVIPQVAVVLGVCGATSALAAANADVCIQRGAGRQDRGRRHSGQCRQGGRGRDRDRDGRRGRRKGRAHRGPAAGEQPHRPGDL